MKRKPATDLVFDAKAFKPHIIEGRPTVDDIGYVLVYCPSHPRAQQNGYVPRSRLVVENTVAKGIVSYDKPFPL